MAELGVRIMHCASDWSKTRRDTQHGHPWPNIARAGRLCGVAVAVMCGVALRAMVAGGGRRRVGRAGGGLMSGTLLLLGGEEVGRPSWIFRTGLTWMPCAARAAVVPLVQVRL